MENISKLSYPCVVTIGMYDGVHIGHQKMLKELVQIAQKTNTKSCVITFANHPRTVLDKKNDAPIKLLQTNAERFTKIAQFGIDYLIPITFTQEFAKLSPTQFLDILKSKIDIKLLLLGYDNTFGNPNNNEYNDLLRFGCYQEIKIQKEVSGIYYQDIEISSTQIRKSLLEGNIINANAMLGSTYNITSKVIRGFQNGRKIGFPTANISLPLDKVIPKQGVYATNTIINAIRYKSVTNIGNNPTLNATNTTIETYIIDFNRDIYDKIITIEFLDFIRDEKKFDNLNDLSLQIQDDVLHAKNIMC